MHWPLVTAVQRRVAAISIGPSTVRGKGNTGVASAAQQFLASLSLARFSVADGEAFVEVQGTAEGQAFARAQLEALLDLAQGAIRELLAEQRRALAGHE